MLVLVGLVPLVLVVAALFRHRGRLQLSLVPFGLGAIAAAFALQLPPVDWSLDREMPGGANISHLAHILLAGVAWWLLGIGALMILGVRKRGRWFRAAPPRTVPPVIVGWTMLNLAGAIAAIAAWRVGDASRVEVGDIVDLSDTGSRMLLFVYLAWAFVGGVVVVSGALAGLREPAVPRPAARIMLLIGICGIGYAVHSTVLLAMGSAVLQAHSRDVTIAWVLPGLLLLAGIGWKGLRASLRRSVA